MSTHTYTEDKLVEQPATQRFPFCAEMRRDRELNQLAEGLVVGGLCHKRDQINHAHNSPLFPTIPRFIPFLSFLGLRIICS